MSEPQRDPSNERLQEARSVGFLDILGSRELARTGTTEDAGSLYGALGTLHGVATDVQILPEFDEWRRKKQLRAYSFSDHLVITGPATAAGFMDVVDGLKDAYGRLVFLNQLASRGAVCVGEVLEWGPVIGGSGLVMAAEAESSTEYPRLQLCWKGLSEAEAAKLNRRPSWRQNYYVEEGPERWLHPAKSLPSSVGREWAECLERTCTEQLHVIDEAIPSNRDATPSELRIRRKWQWLRDRCDDE